MLCNTCTVVQNIQDCMFSDSNHKGTIESESATSYASRTRWGHHATQLLSYGTQVAAIPFGLQDVKQPPQKLQY